MKGRHDKFKSFDIFDPFFFINEPFVREKV